MTGHEAQQILDAIKRVEGQLHARVDNLDREVSDATTKLTQAIDGMRDRHHDSMNVIQGEVARLSISFASLSEQLHSHQRLTDTALGAIADALKSHQNEPGHTDMITWRANVTGKAMGLALGIGLGGGVAGSGIVFLIQNLFGGSPT